MDFKKLIKRYKRYWPYGAGAIAVILLVVLVIVLVTAGGEETPTEPSLESTGVTTLPTESTAPSETTEPTTAPTETTAPPMLYRHPLTGEPLYEPNTSRPIAVMLNNIKQAMPQHGVSQADILYEVLAEGGVTRCMGIFTNIQNVEKLGSLRSARQYYIDIAQGYGAAYLHAGGSDEALIYLANTKDMNLDAGRSGEKKYDDQQEPWSRQVIQKLGLSSTYFYRDQNRLNSGYAGEHTLFTSGEVLLEFAKKQGISITVSEDKTYNMVFDDEKVIVGESANKISVYFNQGGVPNAWTKSTILTYNPDTKTYFAQQHGGDYIDGNNKETISFRNIVVLKAATSIQPDNVHLTIQTVGSGEGYFACNGQIVKIRWSRNSVNEPFTFTQENGTPITYGVGKTYIGVIPSNGTVSYE